MSEFADLDSFAAEYKPDAGGFYPGLETINDGNYVFAIQAARLDRARNGDRILELHLRVAPGTYVVQHTYWLNRQESMNRLAADLLSLGFDSDRWGTQDRPLSKELPQAAERMKGLYFQGHKSSNEANGKTYANLRIVGKAKPQSDGNGQALPSHETVPSDVPEEDTPF